MKKGFTLIELLAVIVILAIVALIAAPLVLNIIDNAKESAILRSAENYLSAIEISIGNERVKNPGFSIEDGVYLIQYDGDICLDNLIDNQCDGDVLHVDVKNQKPSGEQVVFVNEEVETAILKYGDKIIEKTKTGEVVIGKTTEEKYKEALESGWFLGTIDKYILEEKYNVQLGDVINYNSGTEYEENGGKWLVLGVSNSGQVMLVSSNIVGTKELTGKYGYHNVETILDGECSKYANGTTSTYARSIRVEDLTELIGYDPSNESTGKPYLYGETHEYGSVVTYTYKDGKIEYKREGLITVAEEITIPVEGDGPEDKTGAIVNIDGEVLDGKINGKDVDVETIQITNDYYVYKVKDVPKDARYGVYEVYTLNDTLNGDPSRTGYEDIFFAKDAEGNMAGSYWFANQNVLAHASGIGWGVRYLNYEYENVTGSVTRLALYQSSKNGEEGLEKGEFSQTTGVRAVVYLDSTAYFTENSDGTYDIGLGNKPNEYMVKNDYQEDEFGNVYWVPKGFKVINKEENVTDGIVIRDKKGNDFVWVPVPKENQVIYTNKDKTESKDIDLARNTLGWNFDLDNDYKDDESETKPFIESVEKYGGYYIARYEARYDTNKSFSTDQNDYIYATIKRTDAINMCKSMYSKNSSFATSLMNSYAWDTAVVFIETFESDRTIPYRQQKSLNSSFANKGTNKLSNADKACNIYDMASNLWEWTTETYSDGKPIYRGGNYISPTASYATVSVRGQGPVDAAYTSTGFRPVLYLK